MWNLITTIYIKLTYFQVQEKMKYPVQSVITSSIIPQSWFSSSVTSIAFSVVFNKPVSKDNLPLFLTTLIFGDRFNQPVDNLPQTLTSLTFGFSFNQKVDNLPINLKTLIFWSSFNRPVDSLPCGLHTLAFSPFKPITTLFLPSLIWNWDPARTGITDFLFSDKCNFFPLHNSFERYDTPTQPISMFDQSIEKLPTRLSVLVLGEGFHNDLTNLPANLTHLFLNESTFDDIYLPPTLTHLCFWYLDISICFDTLPSGLISLISLTDSEYANLHTLSCLKYLCIGNILPSTKLPISLTHLAIGKDTTDVELPPHITHLKLQAVSSSTVFPQHLEYLQIEEYPPNLGSMLPNSVTHISSVHSLSKNSLTFLT
jgi:FNIP Repeat